MNNINVKNMVICVSGDLTLLEFHTSSLITPCMPFVTGPDRFNLTNNFKNIIGLIKEMMVKEGFNQVTCMKSDLVIYQELIMELMYIPGLAVKVL